ncbi:phd transcription [Diplodia corticola]|uniref:Phd transcription n=1 Tax=Diplodia corticola TaxID=236234 RepID=A0A1J9S9T3_9PEZI|nr:phd transcription [Diplodia corticola]OJD36341.1 phd transcription [Diplodia corticola]
MSFKLSALLNPASEPSSPKRHPSEATQAPPAPTSGAPATVDTSTLENASDALYEAADALTGLAQTDPSPRNSFAHAPTSTQSANGEQEVQSENYPEARRASSYASVAVPVEPLSVDAAPEQHSPSLEQYHHRSKSPEEQRRQSLISMSSNPHVLPPIHALGTFPERRPSNEPQQPQDTSYGRDASQVVSTSEVDSSKAGEGLLNVVAQSREPDFVREEPTTDQIRAPSPSSFPADIPVFQAPSHSPTPQVKLEPSATSREPTPAQAALKTEQGGGTLEVETLRAVASARNEHGLRGVSREASTATPSTAPTMDPTPAGPTGPKKRKLVDSKVRKKGSTGPKQPGSKKRKVEDDQGRPSPTPSAKAAKTKGSKKSATGTPVAGSSPAAQSSPPPHQTADEDEDEESGSDDGIYCICRKGDNHTWMIACDGSCQDWYHGKCVNVKESDGDLIEKYFCPRCTEAGEGYTTWKRMCRRDGCRRPARRDEQSKYCSDECGRLFFQSLAANLRSQAGTASTSQKPRRERRKTNHTDGVVDGEDTEEDGTSGPRGATLSARDLKALTLSARDVNHFKDLGNSMLSPPATASPSSPTFNQEAPLSGPDAARVAEIEKEIEDLNKRLKLLKDRERLVFMVREQVNAVAEREGVKPKDICGYDSRLNWSEGEFALWRATPKGNACFRKDTLDAEPEDQDKDDIVMQDAAAAAAAAAVDGTPLVNGTGTKNGTDVEDAKKQELLSELLAQSDVCLKKRCQRHTQWVKIAQYDVSFESSVARNALHELMADEREIRHRALVGLRKERKAQGGDDAMEGEDGVKEGWVEVLD